MYSMIQLLYNSLGRPAYRKGSIKCETGHDSRQAGGQVVGYGHV